MSTELTMLAMTLVLAIVQILLAAQLRTRETGLNYNFSPRDEPSPTPPGLVTARLMRAQQNLMETLPIFAAEILIVQIAHLHNAATAWSAMIYFWARVIYVPLYAFGIPMIRTLVWLVSLFAMIVILAVIVA